MSKELCFVIGPIGESQSETRRHAHYLLGEIIEPVFAEHFPNFTVERADKMKPGMITSQVITRLMDAPLVVADMSFHNANAFYELAIRHMVRGRTIHVIHRDWEIPFDVQPHRAIQFSFDYRDVLKARDELRFAVNEVIKQVFDVENPITHARGRIEFDRHASDEMKVLIDTVESFGNRLTKIEERHVAAENAEIVRALLAPRGVAYDLTALGKGSSANTSGTFYGTQKPQMEGDDGK